MASNGPITLKFFGIHVKAVNKLWPSVPLFGAWRSWDMIPRWADQQSVSGGPISFSNTVAWLPEGPDSAIAGIAKASLATPGGVDAVITLGHTPPAMTVAAAIGTGVVGQSNPTNQTAGEVPQGNNSPPYDLNDWKNYVTAMCQRYPTVMYWEIWNEITYTAGFSGTIGGKNDSPSAGTVNYGPGSDMYNLVTSAATIIRNLIPGAKILSPSVDGGPNNMAQVIPLLRDLYNGGWIDIIAVHTYSGSAQIPDYNNSNICTMAYARQYRQMLKSAGIPLTFPIWATEFGWVFQNADGTPIEPAFQPPAFPVSYLEGQQQMGIIMRAFLVMAAQGYQRVFWYMWDEQSMGLLEPSTNTSGATQTTVTYKPAVVALQILQSWILNRSVSDLMIDPINGVCSVEVIGNDGFRGLIMWNTNQFPQILPIPPGYTTITQLTMPNIMPTANQTWPSNTAAASLPYQLDPPQAANQIPNPIAMSEGASYAPGYTVTYRAGTNDVPYKLVTTPAPSGGPNYATGVQLYAGVGTQSSQLNYNNESDFSLTSGASLYLYHTPVLLTR
jgi:hypothetical protein